MRGISEIIEANETPHHRSSEMFGVGRHTESPDVNRPFESNMADKREQAERGWDGSSSHARVQNASKGEAIVAGILADLFIDAALESVLNPRPAPRHSGMEGIHSAIDAEPPFPKFWQKLNDDAAAHGRPELGYGQAKEAFLGGPTPAGALTFIGKEYDGLRAIPAKPYDGHKTYYGEFRQVSDNGTIWRTVHNPHGPIGYASPEAALYGARHAKLHMEAHSTERV
jgi:hypothetical protein